MTLKISDDPFRRAGYALLDWGVDAGRDVIEVSVLNMLRNGGEYLGPSTAAKTNWVKQPHYFTAQRAREAGETAYRLGPEICNYLPPNIIVEIASKDSAVATEQLEWPGITAASEQGGAIIGGVSRPSPPPLSPLPNPGSASRIAKETQQDLPPRPSPESRGERAGKKGRTTVLDHAAFRRNRLNADYVIDFKSLERALREKPASTFSQRALAMPLAALASLTLVGLFPALGLMGIIGWEATPERLTFEGPAGGPFSPQQAEIRLRRAWYVASIERILFPGRKPFRSQPAADWLNVEAAFFDDMVGSWRLRVSPSRAASQATEGERFDVVELEFPWAWKPYKATEINLRVSGRPKLTISPSEEVVFTRSARGAFSPLSAGFVMSNPATIAATWRVNLDVNWVDASPREGRLSPGEAVPVTIKPNSNAGRLQSGTGTLTFENVATSELVIRQVRLAVAPPPPTAPAPIETGVACDRSSGNRFDRDRPADRPFVRDTAVLSEDEIEQGISNCQAAARGDSANRRFMVQLGRLYAERGIRQARRSDFSAADADMRKAQDLWQEADRRGSAYGARLMGALWAGEAFNVGGHEFVQPDDVAAAQFYRRAMERGDIIGQRNYAARLLNGLGADKDIPRGITLLRHAMQQGDIAAAGVLGVALFTRYPPDVPENAEEGWELMKQAYCVHGKSREVVDLRIAKGEKNQSERPSCQ